MSDDLDFPRWGGTEWQPRPHRVVYGHPSKPNYSVLLVLPLMERGQDSEDRPVDKLKDESWESTG